MSIFGKKKVVKPLVDREDHDAKGVGIKVLGSGCSRCNALEKAAKEALLELGMTDKIDHVTDFTEIASYGVMSTPALVVDGKVVSAGRVLNKEEAIKLIKEARA